MGDARCFAGLVLGLGLTPRAPDAAAAAVVCVTPDLDAAAQVTFFVRLPPPGRGRAQRSGWRVGVGRRTAPLSLASARVLG